MWAESWTEQIESTIRRVLANADFDFIDVNFFPFETNRILITFGRSVDKYFYVITLEGISSEGISTLQKGLLEIPLGRKVDDVKSVYERAKRRGGEELSELYNLLNEITIFALLLFEERGELIVVNENEIEYFLRTKISSIKDLIKTHHKEITELIQILDKIGNKKSLEEIENVLNKIEKINSIQDLNDEKLGNLVV